MTVSRRRLFGAAGLGGSLLASGLAPAAARAEDGSAPVVDVRAFGAKGDGEADDGPAIQRAIDSFATVPERNRAGGGTVAFGPGEFLVTRTIVLNHGITLAGAGRKATMVRADPSLAGAVIAFDRTGLKPSPDRVTLRDLFVRGAGVPGQTGLFLSNVHSWLVSDCWIGWCDTGVRLIATWLGEFRNSRATRNRSAGLVMAKSDDGAPNQIVFTSSVFDGNEVGFDLAGAHSCSLLGCLFEKNRLGGLRTSDVHTVTVLAHFEANGPFDIALSPDGAGRSVGVTIAGSSLGVASRDGTATGIVIGDADEVGIRGNRFYKLRREMGKGIGVALGAGARNVTICPATNTFQNLDRNLAMREGEKLAPDMTRLNGGELHASLFGGWAGLARFVGEACVLDDARYGFDVVLDRDVDGPLDLGHLPPRSTVRGRPGRCVRRVNAGTVAPGGAAVALRRAGQRVENVTVELDGGTQAAAVLFDGERQAAVDLEVSHGAATAVRAGPAAREGLARDVRLSGSGPTADDPAGRIRQDNVTKP